MLRERILIVIIFLPVLIFVIVIGKWPFALTVAIALGIAGVEFGNMFRSAGYRPALPILFLAVALMALGRYLAPFEYTPIVLSVLCLVTMFWHVIDYERGAVHSGTDMALTLAGSLYVGWIGAYLVSLRFLPDGLWWVLLVLPVIWAADAAAYFVGKAIGKHPFSPRLSPKKTWEGYLGGVVVAVALGALLGALWRFVAGPESSLGWAQGALVALVISVICPIGDLGISMVKRELKVKDTSKLLRDHGGILDRIDTWLWAGVLGYYTVSLFIT